MQDVQVVVTVTVFKNYEHLASKEVRAEIDNEALVKLGENIGYDLVRLVGDAAGRLALAAIERARLVAQPELITE